MSKTKLFQEYLKLFSSKTIHTHKHTQTHTQSSWILSTITRVSRHQNSKTRKVKLIWIYWSRHSESQWHQLGHMQICTLTQTHNRKHTPISIKTNINKRTNWSKTQPCWHRKQTIKRYMYKSVILTPFMRKASFKVATLDFLPNIVVYTLHSSFHSKTGLLTLRLNIRITNTEDYSHSISSSHFINKYIVLTLPPPSPQILPC